MLEYCNFLLIQTQNLTYYSIYRVDYFQVYHIEVIEIEFFYQMTASKRFKCTFVTIYESGVVGQGVPKISIILRFPFYSNI